MAVTNVSQPRKTFNVKNILATVGDQEHYCSDKTYFADSFETTSATNPFIAVPGTLYQIPYRTIKVTNNDLNNTVYLFLNGDKQNYITIQPGETETRGTTDKIFYKWFSIETKAIITAGKIFIEGRV